jgi:hypothetical protein
VLDRYSPVRVSALLVLPESNARSFQIASALGAILDGDGTRNSLKSAKDATGVQITRKRRDQIIDHLGISPRRWRQLVDDWERRQIAHRCSSGTVVLFTRSFLVECPSCHQPTEATEMPSTAPKPRGRPFGESGSITSAKTEASLPPSGANASTQAVQTVPFLGTKQEHPTTGVAMRDEEGMEQVQPSEVPLEVPSEISSEGSKNRPDRDPKAWPVPPGGYVSAWDVDIDGKATR